LSLTWSAHISWLFGELPYLERVGAARRAGFHRIETAWPPDDDERDGLARALATEGMEVVLLNCDAGDADAGERGFLNDPARREEAERAFLAAAELAQRIGAPNLNLLVGRELAGTSPAAQRRAVAEALSSFAPEAAARGLRILVEPINSIENPGYLAPTPRHAIELIEQCGSDALGVLLDVYHVARSGEDPMSAIERCGALIGHVQLSDCPGRGRPGSGELDVPRILESLGAGGYRGSVGLEYAPRGTTESSLELLREERYPVLL
jgi:hydroxypyruvate isomerase